MRLALFLAPLLVALAAGCAGDPDSANTRATTPAPTLPSATAPEVPPQATTPMAQAEAQAGPALNESIRLDESGATEGEHCPGVLRQVEQCVITAAALRTPLDLPLVERPTLLELAISVDEPPQAPGCAWAVLRVQEGDAWISQGDAGKIALGGSPLAIAWSLSEYPPGSRFHVAIHCGADAHLAEGLVTAYNGWAAPFRLEGKLHHETRTPAS